MRPLPQALAVMDACKSEKFCHEKLGLEKVLGEMNEQIVNVNGGAIALGHQLVPPVPGWCSQL